jgi:hypothetical protein
LISFEWARVDSSKSLVSVLADFWKVVWYSKFLFNVVSNHKLYHNIGRCLIYMGHPIVERLKPCTNFLSYWGSHTALEEQRKKTDTNITARGAGSTTAIYKSCCAGPFIFAFESARSFEISRLFFSFIYSKGPCTVSIHNQNPQNVQPLSDSVILILPVSSFLNGLTFSGSRRLFARLFLFTWYFTLLANK